MMFASVAVAAQQAVETISIPGGWSAWWDASTIDVAGGADVTTWADKSGSYTLTSTGAAAPVMDADAAVGHPAVVFNGSNNYMTDNTLAAMFNTSSAWEVYSVHWLTATTANVYVWSAGSSLTNSEYISMATIDANPIPVHWGIVRSVATNVNKASTIPVDVPAVFRLTRDGTDVAVQVDYEAEQTNTGFTGPSACNRFTVGCLGRGGYTNHAAVKIAEMIFYPTALGATQRQQVLDYLRAKYSVEYVAVSDAGLYSMTLEGAPGNVAELAAVPGATALREQDSIIHDPTDPNLGTHPERLYKHYFSATFGSGLAHRIYVTFSADGVTWGAPVECTMGAGRTSEDPSVVTLFNSPGTAYRDGDGLLTMYCEDRTDPDVYCYTSTDGIVWTDAGSNPVIARTPATWDAHLAGSPHGVFDGTNWIVGYEGIVSAGSTEGFGIATGTSRNSLTKLAANPVWIGDVGSSTVVDTMTKHGSKVSLLTHSGISAGVTVWRGQTSELDPSTWANGDIVKVPDVNLYTVRNDLTMDYSDTTFTTVVSTNLADNAVIRYRLWGFRSWT